MTYQDPGWRAVWKYLPLMVLSIPFAILAPFAILYGRRLLGRNVDGITRLRALFVQLQMPLVGFLVVLYFISREKGATASGFSWFPLLVIAVGFYELGGLFWLRSDRWLRSKRAQPLTPRTAAGAYVGAFFIGIGLALTPALVGFVGVFMTGELSSYLLGLAFAVPGFLFIAPTQADMERRQRQLNERGMSFSLGEALMVHGGWPRR